MSMQDSELQSLIILASKAIKSIRSEPDYQESDVLKEYIVLYEKFIDAFDSNNLVKLELKFHRLSSLSRAFLETSNDWKKPCLDSMYDFEKSGKKFFEY